MGNALNSAVTNENKPNHLTKMGQAVDARYSPSTLRNPPSLQALKLQDVLMKNAGGRICEDRWHELDLATFKRLDGMRHLTHEDVVRLFEELRGATLRHVNRDEGHTAIYGLIAIGRVDFEDVGKVRYKFDDEFRKVMEMSDLYAVLDYRTTLALRSRYAHRLHEMIALRAGRDTTAERFTVEDLRARLGVETRKLTRWPDFRIKALDRAIEEINQSSRFAVSYRVTRRERRKTTEIELTWLVKADFEDAKKEQKAHSAARKGRRAEKPERLTFPETGAISYNFWGELVREHAPKPTPDVNIVASAFRRWIAEKNIPLDGLNIEKTFVGFCRKYKA